MMPTKAAFRSKRPLPLGSVYRYMEPGPVVLLSTSIHGKHNIMAHSWHTMMEFTPPLIGCVISESNYTFDALVRTRECVINILTSEIASAVAGCGNTSGRTVDKFAKFGLTPAPAMHVQAPHIQECVANFECRLIDTRLKSKYNFLIMQVVYAWYRPARGPLRTLHHLGRGEFMIAGRTRHLPSHAK